ncbi:MAG: hypothetical protein M1158_01665 [Candidatus Marsarchaeota archaeon]|jgi:hypothetical protein|nr:hypothetical protein [Candidatus Marsarchaeota archaeon]
MLLGAYFIARAGIAVSSIFIAGATAAMAAVKSNEVAKLSREVLIAGYIVAAMSLFVYIGVLHAG